MAENNKFTSEDFAIVKVNNQYAELEVKNVITGNFVKTGIILVFDDIEFSSRLNNALADIAKSASDATKTDDSEYTDLISKINTSDEFTDDNKKIMSLLLSLQCEISKVQAASEVAKIKFDEALGEGSLDKVVNARYGRIFLPNIIFIGSLLSFLLNAGSALLARELNSTLNDINKRFENV